MSPQLKRWKIEKPLGADQIARMPDLPPLLVQLLFNRGIREPAGAQAFLEGRVSHNDPFKMKGVPEAVTRLRQAIRSGEQIAVYGDFDADGVTATTLLVQVLSALGARVQPYIPHRVNEGYGLNLDALRTLYRRGARLVVTVDCGIRSVREVSRASRGLDLVVTDHHTPGEELPPAVAIINPKQPGCPYPYKDLAGVGLAFKLAQALLRNQEQMGGPAPLPEESLLDLVALGTVADLSPLRKENRSLVRHGLEVINRSSRPGIEALMAEAGVRRGDVDAIAIGFRLAPRLNAAGRIDTAMLAYELLSNTDPLQTRNLARQLGELNSRRQRLTEETFAAAEALVAEDDPDAYLHLAASKDFESGIVGLAASRLTEAHYRPSVVVELGDQQSRGSCRSIPEFNITEALDQCRDLLIRHGGHAAAAGFTVANENLQPLKDRLQTIAARQLASVDLQPKLRIDMELPLDQVDWATRALLDQMEPCGMANPQAVLLSRNVKVQRARAIGGGGRHLKLALSDGRGVAWDAIYFQAGDRLAEAQAAGHLDLVYTLEVNEWNHRKRLQLNVQDFRQEPGVPSPE
ncbi:single-stranded-DNA-specific exonuclease RecJ [Chloroflexota bacterium]